MANSGPKLKIEAAFILKTKYYFEHHGCASLPAKEIIEYYIIVSELHWKLQNPLQGPYQKYSTSFEYFK